MGTGSFIFASKYSHLGVLGTGLLGPGPTLMCLLLRLVKEGKYKHRTGNWCKKENSRVLHPNGALMWKSLIPLAANVLTNVGYFIVLTLAWKLSKAAELNQGVITTLLSLASLINIVIFYFKFGEKVSTLHLIGVFLMIACVICISMAATKGDKEDYDTNESLGLSQTASGIAAVVFGILSAIFMSTKHYFIRQYKSNYPGVDMGIDSGLIEFMIFSILLIPLRDNFAYTWTDLLIGSIAGILGCLGRIFIAIGISVGIAGPAQSLMSTHALHQTFWSAVVAG